MNFDMEAFKEKLANLWAGNIPLAQTFWLYYVALTFVLGFIGNSMNQPFFLLLSLLWAGYMVLPIWRAANNYTTLKLYAVLAKVAAVIIGLGTLSNLLNYGS